MGEKRYLTVQSNYHKVQVPVDDIAYITIEGRKTKITRSDGSGLYTNRSLKDIYAELPQSTFSNINRGIVVSKNYVKDEKDGNLTMMDGKQFRRRARQERTQPKPKAQTRPMQEARQPCPVEALDAWLGTLPLPMCVMELVYQTQGGGAEFLLRYCNQAMERLEGVRLADLQDQPLSKLKSAGNPKWLTVFADVAINGSQRIMEDVWPEDGRFMRLNCYQPQSGYCVMMLTDLTRENNLVQELLQRGR